jgi:23S rRNA (guanosine2251-2'-O)-methyltransferase
MPGAKRNRGRPWANQIPDKVREFDPDAPIWLYGHHAVAAALANPARMRLRLVATRNAARELGAVAAEAEPLEPRAIDALLPPGAVHQGIALLTAPLAAPPLHELFAASQGGVLVFLDQVTDPHNVGAILRSAVVFGARGVITTRRHAPPVTGVLAKAASGALEHVPYLQIGNLAEAMVAAREAGFVLLGLDEGGEPLGDVAPGSIALVLGAEGAGLRERTRALCDRMIRLRTSGAIGSLNVSNAAAVALYALSERRR